MSDADAATQPPWEPPLAGTEPEQLTGSLERLRATFRWKADGLGPAGLAFTTGSSTMTIGGLVLHMTIVEDHCFQYRMDGNDPRAFVDESVFEDWDRSFTNAARMSPEQVYAAYADAVARSRAALARRWERGGADQEVHMRAEDGQHANLRRLLADLIEEYGRHTGHLDLMREAFDGRVGEDPPRTWLF